MFVYIRETINVKSLITLLAPSSVFDGDFWGSNPPSAIIIILGLSLGKCPKKRAPQTLNFILLSQG